MRAMTRKIGNAIFRTLRIFHHMVLILATLSYRTGGLSNARTAGSCRSDLRLADARFRIPQAPCLRLLLYFMCSRSPTLSLCVVASTEVFASDISKAIDTNRLQS